SSMDGIYRGLAKKTTKMPMVRECGGTWDVYLDAAIDLCRRYKADAAVFGGHVACKGNWAIAKMVKDRIKEETGIPVLNLEVDLFDPRVTSPETARATIENFFEVNF
ncbi:MAG: 2-hydroxyacyl-CoA dehydratase, partial [Deltaproteobacteria bacterium]|nr:2-hydroxyacyl-CoA dehydratase [Deltaproteobacteria bacterium]